MTSASAVPESTLAAEDNRFILFTENWLNLQSYISSVLTLPITQGDFTTKYGDFPTSDKQLITGCVDAMKNVSALSSDFGDPTSIKSKLASDPAYLGSKTPPNEIFGHMIWMASQIQNQASTFSFSFENLQPLFTGTPEQNAANLKALLTGPGGLTSTAQTASDQVGELMKKLLAFDTKFTDANKQLQDYTNNDSAIMEAANKAVADLVTLITKLQGEADDAYKLWEDLTISAISVSVGLTIISGGLLLPLAAVAGTALGIAAANAKDSYNKLCDEIAKDKAKKKQKSQLVTDLTGLNGMMIKIAPAMTNFKTSLSEIEGVWTGVNNNLLYLVNNYTEAQLGDLNFVMKAMKILDAQAKWQAISNSTQMFVEGSLVTYQSIPYSTKVA
jgi:hypothetical protein